ncbi:uncharacterized protein LOC133890295 [Phragmites australis]|uniref:uncharacterized protein LOC133890295 n=1 Tax=Phragmites australis TaxID=29695 RepID=UPI002D78979E|nr:uncharacterized protein LOC133890295 [Phragmites australis]
MDRGTTREIEVARGEAFRWQWQGRPEEPEEKDIAVDPFSLRQFSRLDIDRPLPIPSVSVADRGVSPAPFGSASVPSPAAPSPRLSADGRLKAPAAPTGWDDAHAASSAQVSPKALLPRSRSSAGGETELSDGGFNAVLSSSERRAGEPQRWGSDVPLIATAGADEERTCYAIGDARGKNGRRNQATHAGFNCCLYLPGLTRRRKPSATEPVRSASMTFGRAAAESDDPGTFGRAAVEEYSGPGTARPNTMSLAVSLERFDCGSLSTSSRGLDLDGGASSSYFDLPLELMLGCHDDDESDLPVCAAFVFDSDGIRKSVLKKRPVGAPPRPSLGKVSTDASGRNSSRNVRFSLTSSSAPAPTPL